MDNALIVEARKKYHRTLIDKCVLTLSAEGVASNADSSSAPSKSIAEIIARKMGAATGTKLKGQTAKNRGGAQFEYSKSERGQQ